MSSSEPENDHDIYGTVDPFSGQLLLALEGPRVLLHFNNTQDLRGFGCWTMAEASNWRITLPPRESPDPGHVVFPLVTPQNQSKTGKSR